MVRGLPRVRGFNLHDYNCLCLLVICHSSLITPMCAPAVTKTISLLIRFNQRLPRRSLSKGGQSAVNEQTAVHPVNPVSVFSCFPGFMIQHPCFIAVPRPALPCISFVPLSRFLIYPFKSA